MNTLLGTMSRSPLLRLMLLGALVLVLQIPAHMIGQLAQSRQQSRQDAAAEVARSWGGRQDISGPFLVVPYGESPGTQGWQLGQPESGHVVLVPEELEILGRVGSEVRRRGLFELPVYGAELHLTGRFRAPAEQVKALLPRAAPRWSEAHFVLRLADVHAIERVAPMQWSGAAVELQPGGGVLGAGLHVPLAVAPGESAQFSLDLELRGSQGLYFAAAGRNTRATLQSDWPHPAFHGAWLPRQREVGAQGFSASWQIPAVARGLPAAWKAGAVSDDDLGRALFGVDFLYPVDPYRMSERSLKYCALFIGLTFLVIWLVETLAGKPVHPVQYLLLGAALCLFYLLELSLAEQFGFTTAYVLASSAVTLQVSLYARAALAGAKPALVLFAAVAALYGLLFLLLREEDYALLIGSTSLFAVLSAVMFLTRHIAWSGRSGETQAPQ